MMEPSMQQQGQPPLLQQQEQPQQQQAPAPQPQPQQASAASSSQDEVRSLYVGDLQFWMDENYLYNCFAPTGEVLSVKIIRNKHTLASEGYGFVEFTSHAAAEKILQMYNRTLMPQTEQNFRLNWASSSMGERHVEGSDLSIFVGDLSPDVTDVLLQETFRSRYPSVKGAKVVVDPLSGRSKGYGFVRFGEESERSQAMSEMNGVYCSSRPMRISVATPKRSLGAPQHYNSKAAYQNIAYGTPFMQGFTSENDPNNTTVFVGGLDPNVKDQDLRQAFGEYGDLISVKIPVGKGCGFVQFADRSCAEEAIRKLHGAVIGERSVRLSWGRSPVNKQMQPVQWVQVQPDPNHWNPGFYTYGQFYEGYGYMHPPQDVAAYGCYGNYPQQVS